MTRVRWTITGGVQGVGFRPFVYRTALGCNVSGHVSNTSAGVVIEVQGNAAMLEQFEREFEANLPPLARIMDWTRETLAPESGEQGFRIKHSSGGTGHQVLISPDVATCQDCLEDIGNPENRRFAYAFTNCTNCGPRYTITRSIPYDRPTTSMACFPMCPHCQHEYDDPMDRRFHAQPNACPVCGPSLWLMDSSGSTLASGSETLAHAANLLCTGHLLAMKGLGGFHLVCDARNAEAVERLRQRKNRKDKPLAVMVQSIDFARLLCHISETEEKLLTGMERPIVLLQTRPEPGLAPGLSPDTEFIGIMLPYTPLHHELFRQLDLCGHKHAALVMTSGNLSSEPICLGNREARLRLGQIADYFVLHNRDILIRCDDSVVRCVEDRPLFIRRARGYTPAPVLLQKSGPCVLGVGPLLKNTVCLTKGNQAFVSQHIGDLENLETYGFYVEITKHLQDILQTTPQAVVHDLHPDFMSTDFAKSQSLPQLPLQHHYAHIHAVLAENGHTGGAIGLALDGTGLGDDGTLWGGEALWVHPEKLEHKRLGHFSQIMLPGGDAATREPWRIARACLHALGVSAPGRNTLPWADEFAQSDRMVVQMLERKLNSPLTSSCGRLFDAVAAMLGLSGRITYEGQAAIKLEAVQDTTIHDAYRCATSLKEDRLVLDTLDLFRQVYLQWTDGVSAGVISRRFHLGLVEGLADMAVQLAERTSCTFIALSGGVMQNRTIATELPLQLKSRGLTVFTHKIIPPNDACISLGQAVYGQYYLQNNGAPHETLG